MIRWLVLLVLYPAAMAWTVRNLGHIDIPFAAFTSVLPDPNTGVDTVSISTFNPVPGTKDNIYIVRDVGRQLADNGANALVTEVLADGMVWPNEVEEIPDDVFGRHGLWWVANGFLVPTKTDGNIEIIEAGNDTSIAPATTYDITTRVLDRSKWFYHRVYFVDMDKDGLKDALTCRAYVPVVGEVAAEMVWFKHPSVGNPLALPWKENVMFTGPDAFFRYEELPLPRSIGQKRYAIFSTQYFSEQIVVSWTEGLSPDWSKIKHRIIDYVPEERFFECEIVDLNGDGRLDILVTANSETNGKLLAYEIPDDWETGIWVRHVIAEGFKPNSPITFEGMGAPGVAFTINPDNNKNRRKPMITMAGDDDSNLYIFEALNDDDPTDWQYSKTSIFEAEHGTVGSPSVRDVTGDGQAEFFVPAYTDGQLHVLTFEP
ncbi:uncharacterized protein [Diadema setosum]|uniref:uncharacterized protein n=1 Tax=Diadema setosum TaxID=31175 RepID=UPI003B3B6B87